MTLSRHTPLVAKTPLPARSGYMSRGTGFAPSGPWSRSVPVLSEGMAGRRETGKSAATSKPKLCTMCREPAARGSWYCAACLVVRELVLTRDGCACVCCGTSVIDRHYSLGHRLRASHGGRAVPSNLITLLGLGGELHHGRIDLYRDPDDATKGYRLKSGQNPKQVRVLVVRPDGSRFRAHLWDDGQYHFDGPEVAAA